MDKHNSSLFAKGIRFLNRIMYQISPSYHNNIKKWEKLRGKYKGKRIFLIGNGPSLNKTPLYLLKNEYTLCFNRFGLMLERFNWTPSFYAMADGTVLEDTLDDVKEMIIHCNYSFFVKQHGGLDFEKILPKKDNVMFFYGKKNVELSTKLPYFSSGSTVAIQGLQILYYMGFSEIYLVGVDMNYVLHTTAEHVSDVGKGEIIQSTKDDDPNHFDPRYFGKGAKYSQPNEYIMKEMLTNLELMSRLFDKTKTKVINVGYDSKVESFEKRNFIDVLGYEQSFQEKLFLEVVKKHGYETLDEFTSKCKHLKNTNSWDSKYRLISMPIEEAIKIIKVVILEYIPVGPFKTCLYFIKRNSLAH